jgi:hypothetical protein
MVNSPFFGYSHINEAKVVFFFWRFTMKVLTSDTPYVNKEHFLQKKKNKEGENNLHHVKSVEISWARHDRPTASYVVEGTPN